MGPAVPASSYLLHWMDVASHTQHHSQHPQQWSSWGKDVKLSPKTNLEARELP